MNSIFSGDPEDRGLEMVRKNRPTHESSVTIVAIKAADDTNRRRLNERQGRGSDAERGGARVPRGACPKAQGVEAAARPLQDHPSLRRATSKQGDRRADRDARAHFPQVAQAVRREAYRGLSDEYRSGRPRTVTDDKVSEVVERTLSTMPKDATHWSVRSMAETTGCRTRPCTGPGRRSACCRT